MTFFSQLVSVTLRRPRECAALEGRRPGPLILRGSLRSHLRMTDHEAVCKPCRAGISAMHHNAGASARALIYVTVLFSGSVQSAVITDPLFYLLAIPAVTLLGLARAALPVLGMIATPLLALVVPPLRRRRHPVADPHRPGRHFGLDLPPRLERLESESAAARLGVRRRRRLGCSRAISPMPPSS